MTRIPDDERTAATVPDHTEPLFRRILTALLRLPFLVLVTIYFLVDDVVLAMLRPLVARLAALRLFVRLAAWIDGLGAYSTLVLFLVPFVILEPVKIGALVLLAQGQMVTGGIALVTAHLLSIVLVERLFHATRDKLLTIGWFAWIYGRVMRLYDWSLGRLRATAAWRTIAALLRHLRGGLRIGFRMTRRVFAPVGRLIRTAVAALRRRVASPRP